MRSNLFRTTLSALLAVALLAGLAALLAPASPPQALAAPAQAQAAPASANGFSLGGPFAPGDTSGLPAADSLADEPAGGLTAGSAERREMFMLPRLTDGWTSAPDGALQTSAAQTITPPYLTSFEGIQDTSGIQPPDTVGQVGPNDYILMVNSINGGSEVGIYNKTTGALKFPTFGMANLFPLASACRDYGAGDPVVLYDQLADRWVLTQFIDPGPPYYECFAISKTGTPTNLPADWWVYSIPVHASLFNDYPKLGVWPDGYYMMAHQFTTSAWAGTGVWVFERDKMLNGQPATFQYKNIGLVDMYYAGMLPSNLMGEALPPIGSPNYFIEVENDWPNGVDTMHIFAFDTDWANPNNTSFSLVKQLPVAAFSPVNCGSTRGQCVDQPNDPLSLEVIGDRLMMHAWYRNQGGHEVIVVNHTVNADGNGKAGVRWYEIRKTASSPAAWSIYQQGTYSPDGDHRWMGSIAMDHVGNIAIGYSVSSLTQFPSIRYALRQPGDPLGSMGSEESLVEGGSAFAGYRWGDYSSMTVDPVDDCTFWYTQEYVPQGTVTWHTRFGSFRYPSCTKGPTGVLQGVTVDALSSSPLPGTAIQADSSPDFGLSTLSLDNGGYSLNLPVGVYTLTAARYGYLPISIAAVQISENQTTTLNLALTPAATATVSGKVTDATTGWPLYAQIAITGSPFDPNPPANLVWTDLSTGVYSVTLATGGVYTLTVNAALPGYTPSVYRISAFNANLSHSFALQPDLQACTAPGYSRGGFAENFDAVTPPGLPADWQKTAVATSLGVLPDWVTNQGTSLNMEPNYASAAHSAPNLVYFNSFDTQSPNSARLHRIVPLDMTRVGDKTLKFWMYHDASYGTNNDAVQVQVSTNGGTAWVNAGSPILRVTGSGWLEHSVNLSAYASQTGLLIGFLGISDYGMDVHLDDISLDPLCTPRSGGLVVGTLTNGDSGLPLTGVTIQNDLGEVFQSASASDPLSGGSFYAAFSPAGSHVITATRSGYGQQSALVPVVLNKTTRQDFTLYAGKLTYTPASLTASLAWGASASRAITVTNIGQGSATFEITATLGGFNPLWPEGRPPFKRKVKAWPAENHLYQLAPTGGQKSLIPVQPYLWASGLAIPTGPVVRAAAASCDGKTFYLFGGENSFGVTKTTQRYNPAANAWTTLEPMPVALTNIQAVCIGNYIYLTGGYNGSLQTNEFQIYDTQKNLWAHSSWPNVRTPMAATYNRKLYAFGGSPGPSAETWMYNPQTNVWQNLAAPMPVAAEFGAAVTVGDYIYIIGGVSGSELKKVQRYDPNNNTWSLGPDLPDARVSPIAAWYGSKLFVSSGGKYVAPSWVAYDSTYSYDFAAFPGGSWVKEADLIPQPVMGAASVCAANRIYALGGNTNRVNYAVNQYMDTGLQCHYGVNSVPWLSILPTTGSLPGGQSSQARINLGLNAADPSIFQPGSYFANLIVSNDTIFGAGIVPVTMTVQAPASWGKLTGVVQNMGYCAASPSLLNQAQVLLEASSGVTATLTTNAQGVYTYWLDQAAQPVTVTVTYTGLQSTTISGLGLSAGQVTNQNIALHPAIPCAQSALTQINADVITGQSLQIPLNLANNGHASLAWELLEIPGQTGAGLGPVLPLEAKSSRPSPAGYSAGLYQPFDPNLALLQEGFESGSMPPSGWTKVTTNALWTWGISQTTLAHSGTYGAYLPWDYSQDEWLLSPSFSAAEGVLSFWSVGSVSWCRDSFNNCDLNVWIVVGAPGGGDDIFVGKADDSWPDNYVWAQSTFDLTNLLPAGLVRIGFQYLGNDGNDVALDDIRLDGLTNSNVAWLGAAPTSGTLAGGAASNIQVTLTALPTMTVNTIYTATLQIRSNDLFTPNIRIPVTLTVKPSEYRLNLPVLLR